MQLINRCAVLIKPKQPFVDWINQVVPRAEREFTLEELRTEECTVILVPDLFGPVEVLEYVAPMKSTLFEMELEGWYTIPEGWPEDRTNETFDEWFDLEIYSMVWDAASTAIVGEEERTLIPPDTEEYPSPVAELLTYGKAKRTAWPDYVGEFNLGPEHMPALVQMATDERLNEAHPESREVWAPVHAWRALAQLGAKEAIKPLMRLFHEQEEDDYVREELPEVYGRLGPPAIPALAAYLADTSHGLFPRATAVSSLEQIGERHPGARDECVAILTRELERFERNEPELNGFLISALLTLEAEESAPVMQRAFAAGAVDEFLVNWDDVQRELGIKAPPKQRRRRRRRKRRK